MQLKQLNYWHPLIVLKFILSRYIMIDNYCKRCGKDTEPFFTEDSLWLKVTEGKYENRELCFRCFDLLNEQKGLNLCWQVSESK